MSSELPPPPPPPGYGGVSGYPSGYPGYQGHPGYAPPAPAGYQPYTGRQYAGFWQRFLALFIDGLIATLFVVPALVALFAGPKGDARKCTIDGEPGWCRYPSDGTIAVTILLGLAGVIAFIYIYCKMVGETGQSWGRKAASISVVDQRTGAPIGFGRAVGRHFAHILSGFFCYLGYFWMLWDRERQTWHDKLVGTVVVKT